LLDHSVPELSGVKRNIFQFEYKAEVVEARPPRVQLPPPVISQPPALPNVHYLGFYLEKESGVKMASISNSGKIYVGKIGQVLGGKYELLEISPEFIRLRLVQDGKVLRVPLGKGPLNGLDDSAELDEGEEEEEE